ncbi:hypothetical protein N7497_007077 [Penicillium chrysogenum]|nr:hypothetical protein N7497_007077 [Penicillium chrysogenum]
MGFDLEAARITALPEDAFYISDFITEDEEDWLLQKLLEYMCLPLYHFSSTTNAYINAAYHLFMFRPRSLRQSTGKISAAAALDPALAPQTSNMAISPHQE